MSGTQAIIKQRLNFHLDEVAEERYYVIIK